MRLFRAIALATLATAMSSAAEAQSHRPAIGVYAGLDRSTMRGDSVPGPLSKTGFLVGAFLTHVLGGDFAVQPELVFTQKGVQTLDARAAGIVSTDIRLNYVEVPILVRWSGPQLQGRVTPYLLLGPEIAFKAGCDVVVGGLSGSYTCADVGSAGSVHNGVESTDFGGIVGAGLDFSLGARRYTVAARYDYGASDVVRNNTAKNRTASVVAGFIW